MTDKPAFPVKSGKEFEEAVEGAGRVLVVYYATWCGYCLRFLDWFNGWAREAPLPVVGADLDDDDDSRWDDADDIVPTVVLYADGTEVARLDALPGRGIPRAAFEAFAAEHLEGAA